MPPWRDIPDRYGPWETRYCMFRTWQRDGTWAQMLTKLRARADAKGLITWDVSVDPTVCRAHQHAAGPRICTTGRRPPSGCRSPPTIPRPSEFDRETAYAQLGWCRTGSWAKPRSAEQLHG